MIEAGDRLICVSAARSDGVLTEGSEYVVRDTMPPIEAGHPCGLCGVVGHDYLILSQVKIRGWCHTRFRKITPFRETQAARNRRMEPA